MTEKFLHSEPITRLQEWAVDPHTQQPVRRPLGCLRCDWLLFFLFFLIFGYFWLFLVDPSCHIYSFSFPLISLIPLTTLIPLIPLMPLTSQWSHVLAEPLLQLGPKGPVLTVERHFAVSNSELRVV